MPKYKAAALVMVVWCLLINIAFAKTAVPAAPTGDIYVQDYANILSDDTKQQLNKAGRSLQNKTKAQIVVVTVDKLEDVSSEEYALAVLRQWGVGDKSLNNGVVLLIDVQSRASRIEVGYGLEGALPDGKTGELQDKYLLPYFKQGDYNAGVTNTYMALAQAVLGEYEASAADVKQPVSANESYDWVTTVLEFAAVIIVVGLVILDFMFFGGRITMLILSLVSRRGGGNGGGFGGGSGGGGGSSRRW